MTVEADGHALTLGTPQQRAVLALLLIEARHVVSMDGLIESLWPDESPASARVVVQARISELRRIFIESGVGPLIVRCGSAYVLPVSHGALDWTLFCRDADAGRQLVRAGEIAAGAALFRRALSLWRGEAFVDLDLLAVRQAARSFGEARLSVIEARIGADLVLGRSDELLAELFDLVERHPLNERLRHHLMAALHASGRTGDALAAFRDAYRLLQDELGVDPSPELIELHQRILTGQPAHSRGPRAVQGHERLPTDDSSSLRRTR